MPVPQHLLCRFGGSLYGGPSTWSVGLRFRSGSNGDPTSIEGVQARLENWRDAIKALNSQRVFPDALWDHLGAPTRLLYIRCSLIGTDGKEQAVALVEGAPLAIGTSTAKMPSQVAVTTTLSTGRPGASYRGRLYWPALGQTVGGDGLLAVGDTTEIANNVASFVAAVGNAGATIFTPGVRLAVISERRNTSTLVNSIRVGNRLDIQRRRADGQDERYTVAAVPN